MYQMRISVLHAEQGAQWPKYEGFLQKPIIYSSVARLYDEVSQISIYRIPSVLFVSDALHQSRDKTKSTLLDAKCRREPAYQSQ
jgi:hypothetical protein